MPGVGSPAGSVDGDTLPVTVNLVDDGLVEGGDETLVLSLSAPSHGGLGGGFGAKAHTVTLLETDFADLAFVGASSATGAEADTLAVDVELSLDPGDALGIDVDVTLRDIGAGSATSTQDFQAVATQEATGRGREEVGSRVFQQMHVEKDMPPRPPTVSQAYDLDP